MASNPPSKCCVQGFYHEGIARGVLKEVNGLETYVTGKETNERIIVILTDIFGNKLINTQLIADQLGDAGYKVYIPDILFGDALEKFDPSMDLKPWFEKHNPVKTRSCIDQFLGQFRKENPNAFVGVIGHCFGGKYAIQQLDAAGFADSAAVAHPSLVDIAEVEAISAGKPLLISAAEIDKTFTRELRYLTEEKLSEKGVRYQIDLFGGVSHGYAVRGDESVPAVTYARQKTLLDQIYWFDNISK